MSVEDLYMYTVLIEFVKQIIIYFPVDNSFHSGFFFPVDIIILAMNLQFADDQILSF